MNILSKLDLSNRRTLAKAISLIESNTKEDRELGDAIINELYRSHQHHNPPVIAITGAPGAGKSTFIDTFGGKLAESGYKIAVLAIDPSSSLSGGAILGDKTRMTNLARHTNVFIRPSSSGPDSLGGLSSKTEDVIHILKAAAFDYIFIETVGVGQNEADVALIADIVIMLIPPTAGDELQGIKKGNLEFVDLLIVNKFDGTSKDLARATADEYQSALKSLNKKVILASAVDQTGLDQILTEIQTFSPTPHALNKREKLLIRRIESDFFKELASIPKVAQIWEEAVQQSSPTRLKSKIFIEKLKNLLTSQQSL